MEDVIAVDGDEIEVNLEVKRLREDLEQFKRKIHQVNAVSDHMIVELRSEQAAYLEENIKLMEKFDNQDWGKIHKAATISEDFTRAVESFSVDFKKWHR